MHILKRAFPLTLLTLLLALAVACGSSGGGDADDTSQEISDEELAQMVLALEDFGGGYAGFEADENGVLTREQVIEDDSDPEDEAEDLEKFGYVSGYESDFDSAAALESNEGVLSVGSQVLLFQDVEGATAYYADTLAEVAAVPEESGEGFDAVEVEYFKVDAGDEANGLVFTGHIVPDEGDPVPTWIMAAIFRHGRILGVVSMFSFEDRSSEDALNGWARVVDRRIASVLAGAATSDQPADQTDGQTVADDGPDGGSGDLVSTAPLEVLSASADSFQEEVESLQAEMEFSISVGGFTVDVSANMAFQAPDQMYMTMDLTGLGTFEMLMLGTDIYMNIPPQGWVVFSVEDLFGDLGLADLGVDAATFQDLFDDHSLVDYEALVNSVGGDIEDLGEETLEGGTFRHFRGTIDIADVSAAFSDAFGATDDLNLDDVSGPLTFDAWVDPDTFLPHMLTTSGEFAFGADSMVFDATMTFSNYNEPVEIPGAPEDAVSIAELFSGLLEGLE